VACSLIGSSVNQQPPMHQLAVLSTGWAAFFHSAPDEVHQSQFLFAADHCSFSFFFGFLAVFPLDLTCHPAHSPTPISTTPTLVPHVLSPTDIATSILYINYIYKFTTSVRACMRLSDTTILHFNSPAEPAGPAFSMAEPVAVRTSGDPTILHFNSPAEP
jgi:hypothetical protein